MTVTDASPGELHDQLVDIPIGDIAPNPRNRDVGDVADLVASIKTLGIAEPLLVTCFDDDPDRWALIAGHRRLAAAKKAGLTEVPCIVKAGLTRGQAVELSIVENLHRTDLTPTEEADAYAQLVELGWSQRTIAERFKRSQPHVSHRLGILELPDALRARVDSGGITIETAEKLVAFKRADEKTFARYVKGNPSPSVWSIDNQLGEIKRKQARAKVTKPLLARGLKELGRSDYMKWEHCTEKQATAFWFDWSGKVVFVRPKTATPAATNGSAATPATAKKETAKERRVREAREANQVKRREILRGLVDEDLDWQYVAAWIWDMADPDIDEYGELLVTLGLGEIADDDHDCDRARRQIERYWLADVDQAARFVRAAVLVLDAWNGHNVRARKLELLADGGYELNEQERDALARTAREQEELLTDELPKCRICGCTELEPCEPPCSWVTDPNHIGPLCSTCLDLVGTVHDPDAPSGGTAIREAQLARDTDFAEANDLQPGDEVHDDGTIVRADDDVDVDDYEARLRGDIEKPIPARV